MTSTHGNRLAELQGAGSRALAGLLLSPAATASPQAIPQQPSGTDAPGEGNSPVLFDARYTAVYRILLEWDFVFLATYGIALAGICAVCIGVLPSPRSRRAMLWVGEAAIAAAVFDAIENAGVLVGMKDLPSGPDWPWQLAQGAGLLKWALLLIAVPGASLGLVVVLPRLLTSGPQSIGEAARDLGWEPGNAQSPANGSPPSSRHVNHVLPPRLIRDGTGALDPAAPEANDGGQPPGFALGTHRWREAYHVPRATGGLAITASGGGIRSGVVVLGALQRLQAEGVFRRAFRRHDGASDGPAFERDRDLDGETAHLFTVSGGGYTSSAYQLALQPFPETMTGYRHHDAPVTTTVLAPGSVEEDHVRRHGKYIADGPKQWLAALATLGRGLLVSLLLLWGLCVLAGALLGTVLDHYQGVPMGPTAGIFEAQPSWWAPSGAEAPRFPSFTPTVVLAPLAVLAFGILCYAVGLMVFAWSGSDRLTSFYLWCRGGLRVSAVFAGAAFTLGVLIPILAWVAVAASYAPGTAAASTTQAFGFGGAIAVTAGYVATLASVLGRSYATVKAAGDFAGKTANGTRRSSGITAAVPTSWKQALTIWTALALLTIAGLEVLGLSTATVHSRAELPLTVAGVLIIVALGVDETWLSLHHFYRRRLASAFAVRRELVDGERVVATAYDFDAEPTPLSQYGAPQPGHPQLILSAAGHQSGQSRTPPGRHVASVTFSHDWMGGPDVGWVSTAALERLVSNSHLRRDITLQSAVAVSGAAFASAMGRASLPSQTLFALSNARLGTWIPNPAYLYQVDTAPPDQRWRFARLPRIRRLHYLIKELTGVHSDQDPLILVTDGGHYDNLGLVDALRHRPDTVVVIDGSGDIDLDAPAVPAALGEGLRLAREELGIDVTFDEGPTSPISLAPGTATADTAEQVAGIAKRLSKTACLTATTTYPFNDLHGRRATAHLIVVKACLTADMPYEILAYAAKNPAFPFDTTSDQWFDADQFDAYQAIGRYLGDQAVAALQHLPRSPQATHDMTFSETTSTEMDVGNIHAADVHTTTVTVTEGPAQPERH